MRRVVQCYAYTEFAGLNALFIVAYLDGLHSPRCVLVLCCVVHVATVYVWVLSCCTRTSTTEMLCSANPYSYLKRADMDGYGRLNIRTAPYGTLIRLPPVLRINLIWINVAESIITPHLRHFEV